MDLAGLSGPARSFQQFVAGIVRGIIPTPSSGELIPYVDIARNEVKSSLRPVQKKSSMLGNIRIARVSSVNIRPIHFIRVLIFLLLFAAFAGTIAAQTPTPDTSGISADRVNEVARGLWCPLCSGVRLDSCELKACDQMKEMIAIKLAEGATEEEIKAYFLEQYGPQVLGEPPREGFNWLAWILPIVALVGGGLFLLIRSRRMIGGEAAHAPAASDPSAPSTSQDPYSQKLEQELSRYD